MSLAFTGGMVGWGSNATQDVAGLHWIELGRTTLGSTGDDITVSSLANKPYLMVLGYKISSGNSDFVWRVGNSSADSDNHYARRCSSNGGGDTTNAPHSAMFADNGGYSKPSFQVGYFTNIAAREKLNITHSVGQNTAGAGNAPIRRESVSKWVNTSDVIDVIQGHNQESGDYASGSEVVVLGYDPDDTTGTNAWEELGTTTLSSSSDTLDISFTAKKYLMIQWSTSPTGSDAEPHGRCGIGSIDTGGNYAGRKNRNGGSDSTFTNSTAGGHDFFDLSASGAGAGKYYGTIFCVNPSGQEKLIIGESVGNNGTGAGNAPDREEWVGKYTVTSGQINRWQVFNGSDVGNNDLAIGSTISVWGFD